jgi:RNA polymerase sigma-70 factor (ECF subfamily)
MTLQVIRQRDKRDRAAGGAATATSLGQVAATPTSSDDEDARRWLFFCAAASVEQEVQEATWRAFWLTAVDGQSAAAAARELGMTVGNVYSAKCRVLDRIRRRVAELAEERE